MSKDDFADLTNIFNELNLQQDSDITHIIETVKNLFIKCKNNSKELSKLVEKYLIPQDIEKKKNAEVSTPVALCKEMLQPLIKEIKEVFKESDGKINRIFKIFEPCSGKGIFLLEIVEFLIDNSTLTKKQILEECIYFADINPLNIFICKMLLDPNNEYNLNYYEGDTLKLDINKQWNLDGFDAVIGNPPYQKNYDNLNGRVGGSSLWSEFLNYSIKYAKMYMLFITPCSWMTGGKNKQSGNILNGIFKNNTLLYLDIEKCGCGFKVTSTFSYYLLKIGKFNNDIECICKYKKKIYNSILQQNSFRNLQIVPKLLTNDTINIIYKIENKNNNKFMFNRNYDLDSRKKIFVEDGKYKVRHKVIELRHTNYYQQDVMNVHKVIISMPGYIKATYDFASGVTDATLYYIVNNKEYAEFIIKVLNSKVYMFIINCYRELTGLNNHKNINRLCIPLPDLFNYDDLNNAIYEYFNLSKKEIDLIEEIV